MQATNIAAASETETCAFPVFGDRDFKLVARGWHRYVRVYPFSDVIGYVSVIDKHSDIIVTKRADSFHTVLAVIRSLGIQVCRYCDVFGGRAAF